MRVALSAIYQDRSYYYMFGGSQNVRISARKDADITIPGLRGAFLLKCQGADVCVVEEQTFQKSVISLDRYFYDEESNFAIFFAREIPAGGEILLPQKCEVSFGRVKTTKKGVKNQLVIDIPFISAEHGKIVCDGRKTIIIDTNSKNGIYVNGKKIKKAALKDGDVVSLCTVRMTYRGKTLAFENTGGKIKVFPDRETNTEDMRLIDPNRNDIGDLLEEFGGV